MAILINIIDGSQDPNRTQNETHAGLNINRDEALGWRAKLTAMPSKRELMRCVSDCPLAIAENVLLWSKRWGWKVKIHPNSVSLKQLMQEVKSYTPASNPDTVILQGAMLLKNFAPREIQQQTGLPNFEVLLNKMQSTQAVERPTPPPQFAQQQQAQQQTQQFAQQQQSQQFAQQQQSQQFAQQQEWVGPGAEKMKRTQDRYQSHMAQVNATVEQNERKRVVEAEKRQLGENIAADLEKELAEIDSLLNDDTETQVEVPEKFKSKKDAIKWAIDLGCFEAEKEASETYDEVKKESGKKNLQDFTPIWADTCIGIMSA
jgi:hypothetical protein